ncbi:glyoxalase [Paenibacillus sp. CCS19]|uniref:VOC family protein n=1 Tax=Paenibacillus sp. CCS19 TaxID=3158387 RepID=UPI002560AF9E|nr:VOC family protein [Paenibacillus cellulosilyticus]GMK37012.1 glyoxalase [Paenibacillus cellulosilyticus]
MTFTFAGIDHVQLAAPEGCEVEARDFFGSLLGWQELPKPEPLRARGGVWFQCGTHQVHIGVEKNFTPAAKAHPAFLVHDLQALREHLIQLGAHVIDDNARSEENIRRFYMNDPFGNRLEFMEWL